MKNETKTFSEYKAPKCKMVEVQMKALLCASPTFTVANPFNSEDEEEEI